MISGSSPVIRSKKMDTHQGVQFFGLRIGARRRVRAARANKTSQCDVFRESVEEALSSAHAAKSAAEGFASGNTVIRSRNAMLTHGSKKKE